MGAAIPAEAATPELKNENGSYAPTRSFGNGEQAVGLIIVDKLFGFGVPLERALQLFSNSSKQERAGGAVSHFRVANRSFARPDTLQKIPGVAVSAVAMHLIGPKR